MAARGGSAALRTADALLGSADRSEPDSLGLWRYLGTVALLAAVICARRVDAITNPQFWAEDGCLFFVENATLGFWRALGTFYRDFPYLLPRLIALVGGVGPVAEAPRIYTTSAIALTAFAVATFATRAFRHVVRSDALRVVWCVAVVSLPSAGVAEVVLGTPTNLGWFVAIWLTLLSVMRMPRRGWQLALLGVAAGVAIFSTPLAIITLPLWLLRAYRARVRNDRRELTMSLAVVALLAVAVLLTRGLGAMTAITVGSDTIAFSPARWLTQYGLQVIGPLFPPAAGASVSAGGAVSVGGVVAVVLAALLLAAWKSGWRRIAPLLLALALAAGGHLLIHLGRPYLSLTPDRPPGGRYTVYPGAMLALAVIVSLDGLPRGATRRVVACILLVLVVWAWRPTFVIPSLDDQQWRAYAPRVEGALRSACPADLLVPMNPSVLPLRIQWGPSLPERPVLPTSVVAVIGAKQVFRQPFVSQCDELTNVELFVGERGSSDTGTMVFSLLDDSGVLRTARLARADLAEHGWELFCFSPVAGSSGHRFTAEVRAIQNDPTATLTLLGSKTDPGPERRPTLSGESIPAEATLRYSCRTHLPRACFRWTDQPLPASAG